MKTEYTYDLSFSSFIAAIVGLILSVKTFTVGWFYGWTQRK